LLSPRKRVRAPFKTIPRARNPQTVEAADSIYGISMGSGITSKVLRVRLDEPKDATNN